MTEEIDFAQDPNRPTTLSPSARSSIGIGEPFWIDLSQRSDTGELVNSWSLELQVRDEDEGDELEARWRVTTGQDVEPLFKCVRFPANLGGTTRALDVVIERGDLKERRCHRLELIVARTDGFFRPTALCEDQAPNTFDLIEFEEVELPARASWVIFEGPGPADLNLEDKGKIIDSCNALEDFLPSAAAEAQ